MATKPLTYDAIGVGFGPSNLAIAGAFVDKANSATSVSLPKLLFIEKQEQFGWHRGMLIPGSRMQINFLKDLATLRSPQSPITFLSYLHSQNRLLDFINRGSTFPTRKEYADYLSWAARFVQDKGIMVAYGENVIGIGEKDEKTIEVHSVVLTSGEHITRLTKNLIISPGGSPRIPRPLEIIQCQTKGHIIHSANYLVSIGPLLASIGRDRTGDRPLCIAVVGSGQSAAEVTLDLHSRLQSVFPTVGGKHAIDMIIRKGSLKPSDDSPFSNEIFNPDNTGAVFGLGSCAARETIRKEYRNTNYGVVNPRTLEQLYDALYEQKLEDGVSRCPMSPVPRINILPYSEVLTANFDHVQDIASPDVDGQLQLQQSECITIVIQHILTHRIYQKRYDAVICATGYDRKPWLRLLASSKLGRHFGLDACIPEDTCLVAETDLEEVRSLNVEFVENSVSHQDCPGESTPSSGTSTPITSLGSIESCAPPVRKKIYISRAYQLLPKPVEQAATLQARIYVQGVAEETHGLSDTLLSVLGVRAGEVVEDICASLRANKTSLET